MKFISPNKAILFYLAFIFILPSILVAKDATLPVAPPDNVLKIGVRAIKGLAEAQNTWGETLSVLNQNIEGYRFELVPIIGFLEMRNAVKNKNIDFVLTNPLAYTELNKSSGLTRILTLNKKQANGVASTIFAGVIFTRADRKDIETLGDVKGKRIIGVHDEAFGGWRMAVRELLHHGIDPYEDSDVLFSTDNTHQSVVFAVLNGKGDVGTVRTGIIEQLAAQGKIKLNSIKVLNAHQDKLSALHSTQHYPEWPFAVMPHVSGKLSNQVFHSLLKIQEGSPAAIAGKYVNWVAPLDYSEVSALSSELDQQYITFDLLWQKHRLTILLFLLFIIAIIFYSLYLMSINKKLSLSEQNLSQHRDHLEELVNKRTEELVREKEKSDSANKAKSEFLSNMSHELRTPLNAILGFSQLIKLEEGMDTKASSNADEIITAGDYLLSIINEILDLAKIESGKIDLTLEEISCKNIIQESLSIINPLAKKKNITINIFDACECIVMADHKRLEQICINLLSNAVKYNKQDGEINIVLEVVNEDSCKISIKDTGLGIKPEFYDKVFQPFARDKDEAGLVEGTGIGLVITKQLIEQMQGNIGFNSEYGIGTAFWVTLPKV